MEGAIAPEARRTHSKLRLSVLAVALALVPVTAIAPRAGAVDLNAIWPDLNLPGFKVTPFITQRGEYETNVFQTSGRAEGDFISRTIPGVLVELPFGQHRLDLAGRVEIVRYADLDRQDTEHYIGLGQLALNFPGGLGVKVRDEYTKTSDPPGSELTGRIDSTTNTLAPSAEYALGGAARRFSIGADYNWTHVDFESAVNQLDRDEHTIGGTGFWKAAPKTDLLANYAHGWSDFDASGRDVTRNRGMLGVRGQLTSRLTSTFRIGVESRQAEGSRSDFVGYVASGDWVFQPVERTTFTLVTERSVQESTFSTNLFYVSTLVTLGVDHKFGPKLSVSGRIFGGTNDYPDKARKVRGSLNWRDDQVGGIGFGVDYQIQTWLDVGADYSHTRRNSNFDNFDYKDDVIGAKVTLKF